MRPDVLQEVFVEALKRYDAYLREDFASAYLWLRSVAIQTLQNLHRHHVGTQLRSVRREVHLSSSFASVEDDHLRTFVAAITSPSQLAIRVETLAAVRDALQQLSTTDQEIIQLRQFEELMNDEISRLLNIDPKTASTRYIRAIDRLRTVIERGMPTQ